MNMHRIVNICLIFCFFVVILAPVIYINKSPNGISVSENRTLAAFPDVFDQEGKINANIKSQLEAWFNDNLGFREKMIQVNTLAQYDLFNKLNKSDTLLGKDNWLYYVNDDIIKDYQRLNLLSNEELNQWGNLLENVDDYLKSKDIHFILKLNLDKKTIYPEYYPDTILQMDTISRTEQFEDYIKSNTDIDFFTPKEELLQAKKDHLVYSQNYDNGHWNKYGSIIGYKKLIEHVNKYYPNVQGLDFNDYHINTVQREIKINDSVSFIESDYEMIRKDQVEYQNTTNELLNLPLVINHVSFSSKQNNEDLPKVLFIGDSYTYGFLFNELAETFGDFTFVSSENIDKLQVLVDLIEPDLVIFESVERSLSHSMELLGSEKQNFVNYSEYHKYQSESNNYMYIDYINNQLVADQSFTQIDDSNRYITINGWALEPEGEGVLDSIYMKVGEHYYSGIYGTRHDGVAATFWRRAKLFRVYFFCRYSSHN